jgi:hypothetical protein
MHASANYFRVGVLVFSNGITSSIGLAEGRRRDDACKNERLDRSTLRAKLEGQPEIIFAEDDATQRTLIRGV